MQKHYDPQKKVSEYLRDGLLKKAAKVDLQVLEIMKRNSLESLSVAENLFKSNSSSLWIIVCAYYSMYYAANAVLYKIGYKVGNKISHQVTADSLAVFVKDKLKSSILKEYETVRNDAMEIAKIEAEDLITDFRREKEKRSHFQYDMIESAKIETARLSLERAKRFSIEMEKLLKTIK